MGNDILITTIFFPWKKKTWELHPFLPGHCWHLILQSLSGFGFSDRAAVIHIHGSLIVPMFRYVVKRPHGLSFIEQENRRVIIIIIIIVIIIITVIITTIITKTCVFFCQGVAEDLPYRITITVIMVIILIIVHNIETSTITTIIVMAKKKT